ncbi:hypothetical protein [Enterovibrio norvegicus]|uniref:Uncharacterized protein n=1 Tax=Enterovibrio norvegicus TaxID=188144 RepID=A0ABV4KZA4_9GAMM|nr:hypothetical protein [Enterovibrio norvegicus]MCC4798228.1 hypothetical protein [Enterovibrio norvegicus]
MNVGKNEEIKAAVEKDKQDKREESCEEMRFVFVIVDEPAGKENAFGDESVNHVHE